MGQVKVTTSAVQKIAADELKLDISENKITRTLHNMKITTERRLVANSRKSYIVWDPKLMKKIYIKYLNGDQEFLGLLGFQVLETPAANNLEP
jgi:hypothetical protein